MPAKFPTHLRSIVNMNSTDGNATRGSRSWSCALCVVGLSPRRRCRSETLRLVRTIYITLSFNRTHRLSITNLCLSLVSHHGGPRLQTGRTSYVYCHLPFRDQPKKHGRSRSNLQGSRSSSPQGSVGEAVFIETPHQAYRVDGRAVLHFPERQRALFTR